MALRILKHGWKLAAAAVCVGGLSVPARAGAWTPTYGNGPVELRLFTDYFCEPCRGEENEVLALVAQLVDRNAIRVTFVDYPGHTWSSLYAVYFLACLNAKGGGDVHLAAKLRAAFFEASAANIADHMALEQFLNRKGIPFRLMDYRPTFGVFEKLIMEDRVLETPSCTVIRGKSRQTLSGRSKIIQALKNVAQGK